jgi:hypothetical protein
MGGLQAVSNAVMERPRAELSNILRLIFSPFHRNSRGTLVPRLIHFYPTTT